MVRLSYYLMWIFLGLTLFGLYRPWLALWWADEAPRIKVLGTYGIAFLLFLLVYLTQR